jgi:hypothetical protein
MSAKADTDWRTLQGEPRPSVQFERDNSGRVRCREDAAKRDARDVQAEQFRRLAAEATATLAAVRADHIPVRRELYREVDRARRALLAASEVLLHTNTSEG